MLPPDAPRILRSPRLLAWRHGFTTRCGGVSEGVYASLNLGGKWGDDPQAVQENLRRVAETGDFLPHDLVRVRQVHGAAVVDGSAVTDTDVQADALWMHRDTARRRVIGVMTADCVPILLADMHGRAVAAVHSGWRGTVANIVEATVNCLAQQASIAPADLVAAIGPCIEQAAFEVGDEVACQFDTRFVRRDIQQRAHVDLVGCVRAQLLETGVEPRNIDRVGGCTHAQANLYFSYRRDGQTGQQLSFIGFGD